MRQPQHFRRSFQTDPFLCEQLFGLLEEVFPGLGLADAAERSRLLGAAWEDASTPFVRFEDGRLVAHVGVLEIPMRLGGKDILVGGIHAVATRPGFRRRGYYRQLMEAVLDYCAGRYETLLLSTGQPELYEPFGFRVVAEHAFCARVAGVEGHKGFRPLDLGTEADRRLLIRLVETREPVSDLVGVTGATALFYVNECTRPLYYAEDLDVLACLEVEGNHLYLFDLVGPRLYPLAAVVERLGMPIEAVTVYFTPDKLAAEVRALPHVFEGDSLLMVRGQFAPEDEPFMLPRSARC